MTITSFSFLVLLAVGMILYYILPKSWQWIELLLMSVLFYCCAATPYTILYLVISVVIAYVSTNSISLLAGRIRGERLISTTIAISVIINVALWFVLKARDIWYPVMYRGSSLIPQLGEIKVPTYVAALGMGYYTLQVIGYILDCYWGTIEPQKNIAKLFLFVGFFPQLITGPISRYSQLESLFEKHTFSYLNVTQGAQRILWGFFKKLVIAERAGIIVNFIWGNLEFYSGIFHWIALLLYPLQMYADFSGCMDIVIGAAQLFDIKLAENFNNPFFSRNVQEFWQRWHITLGNWAKDYVLYPLLKCKPMIKLGKFTKKKYGKRIGKFIPTAVGMFCLWMVMGIWHGGFKYIIGVSLWYWIILMAGELCSPILKRIVQFLQVDIECFSWRLFQSIRTYLIYAVGAVFFRAADFEQAVSFLVSSIQTFTREKFNAWVLFNGSIVNTGVTLEDVNVLIVGILMLIIVGILREKCGFARVWMQKQVLPFRWCIWMGLFVFVLIYGMYGPGYSAAEFIYQGF